MQCVWAARRAQTFVRPRPNRLERVELQYLQLDLAARRRLTLHTQHPTCKCKLSTEAQSFGTHPLDHIVTQTWPPDAPVARRLRYPARQRGRSRLSGSHPRPAASNTRNETAATIASAATDFFGLATDCVWIPTGLHGMCSRARRQHSTHLRVFEPESVLQALMCNVGGVNVELP